MKLLIKFFLVVLSAFLVTSLHLLVISILPSPLANLNIVLSFLLLLIIFFNSGFIIWLAFLIFLFFDFWSNTVFGTYLLAGTFTTLFAYWFFKEIFTDQSLWSISLMSLLTFLLFRFLYFVLFFFSQIIMNLEITPGRELFSQFAWEILLSTLLVMGLYLCLSWVLPRKFSSRFVQKV